MKKILTALIFICFIFIDYSQVFSQDNSANAVYNAEKKLGIPHSGKIMDRMKNVELKLFGKSNENLSVQQRNTLIQNKLNPASTKKTTTTKTVIKTQSTTKPKTTAAKPKPVVSKKPVAKPAPKTAIKLKEDYEIVIPPRFDSASQFSEGLAAVTVGGKCGYINKSGNFVIQPQYDQCNTFAEGLAGINLNNKWSYLDKNGNLLFPFQYDEVFNFSERLGWVCKEHLCNVIDMQGRPITPNKLYVKSLEYGSPECYPKHYFYFSEGLSRVFFNNKAGFVDRTGNLVIRNAFDGAANFSDGLAAVKLNHKWGFIDRYGNMIVSPQFDEITDENNDVEYRFNEGKAVVYKNNSLILIDKTGRTLSSFSNNLIIDDPGYCYSDGMYAIYDKEKGKIGFSNTNGNLVIDCKFDPPNRGGCPSYFSDNVAVIDTITGRDPVINYKIIDKKGDVLISTKNTIQNFSEGLAAIEINNKWGYIANPITKQASNNNAYYSSNEPISNNAFKLKADENVIQPPVTVKKPKLDWTVDEAKKEVFFNLEVRKDLSWASANDNAYQDSLYAKKKNLDKYKGKEYTFFYDVQKSLIIPLINNNAGSKIYLGYSYGKVDDDIISYYFTPSGKLDSIGFKIKTPQADKFYKYKYPSGELIDLGLYVSKYNVYMFNPKGNLTGHWIDGKCYGSNGKIIGTRTFKIK